MLGTRLAHPTHQSYRNFPFLFLVTTVSLMSLHIQNHAELPMLFVLSTSYAKHYFLLLKNLQIYVSICARELSQNKQKNETNPLLQI